MNDKNWNLIYEIINDNIEKTSEGVGYDIGNATNEITHLLSKKYGMIETDNLYDVSKFEILKELMEICNLQTLEQIADIYSKGTLDYDKVPQPSIGSFWMQNKTVSGH